MRLKSIEQKTYKTLRINLGQDPHPNNKNFRKEKQTAGKKKWEEITKVTLHESLQKPKAQNYQPEEPT